MTALAALCAVMPANCADIARTLRAAVDNASLGETETFAVLLASAHALGSAAFVATLRDHAPPHDPDANARAQTAAALITMSSVYHRAVAMLDDPAYHVMRPGLHMKAMLAPYAQDAAFSLAAIATAAIHGCRACLNAHDAKARARGATQETVHAVLRIAAAMSAADAMMRAAYKP